MRQVCSIIKNFNNIDNVKDFYNTQMYERMIQDYNKQDNNLFISYPLIKYLCETENTKMLNGFSWYNKYPSLCLKNVKKEFDLKERVLYGLPIDDSEYNRLEERLQLSKKYKF